MSLTSELILAATNSVKEMAAAVISLVDQRTAKQLVSETATVAVGASKAYNLATLLGAEAALYNLVGAVVTVRVKDTAVDSPSTGQYISAEATVTVGISDEGVVTLYNRHNVVVDLYVKIDVVRKPV